MLDKVLNYLNTQNFWDANKCTKETCLDLIGLLQKFSDGIIKREVETTLERPETEEEAKAYFGADFVSQFNALLTELEAQETVVAIHGTNEEIAPLIADTGLQYNYPQLLSTVVIQETEFGVKPVEYTNFSGLLNWPHKNYKGLVLVAIPYECFYKEGLWEHYKDSQYGQNYRIPAEFIRGYVDVPFRKIVLNPKYKRDHDYTGLEPDLDTFHKRNINNSEYRNQAIKSKVDLSLGQQKQSVNKESEYTSGYYVEVDAMWPTQTVNMIHENLLGVFNSIRYSSNHDMSSEVYGNIHAAITDSIRSLNDVLPFLKTREQAEHDILEKEKTREAVPNVSTEELDELGFWNFDLGASDLDNSIYTNPDFWERDDDPGKGKGR